MTEEQELKKQISWVESLIDFWRKLWKIQTQLEKLKTETMVRRIATRYAVDVDVLAAVIWAESNMDPGCITKNKNGTTDYGLCQFNDYWYGDIISPHDALNYPEKAVNVMCAMWEKDRQNDWYAYRYKTYIKYLNAKN